MTPCPSNELLKALMDDGPAHAEGEVVAAHVEACPECQEAINRMLQQAAPPGLSGWKAASPTGFAGSFFERLEARRPMTVACCAAAKTPAAERGQAGRSPPQLAGYEILAEVGRGGMGVVYRARQTRLNRLVALKMLLAGGHAGAESLARFRAEAEAVARLQHPHIVQIFEVGDYEGQPYCALELVEGGTLANFLHGEPQAPSEAAQLTAKLARAMHYAHQQGVVHRDLKPGNILLASPRDNRQSDQQPAANRVPLTELLPKITDFGLAKRLDVDAAQTQSGLILGTPSYMAPEQADGRAHEIGPRTDVYALGAVLYELLTGRPPFKAATTADTLVQVVHEEPVPPRRLQSKTPIDLETICLKCLAKEVSRRYVSAAALAGDLDCFLNGKPIQARPVGSAERLWRWCRRKPGIAVLSASLVVAVLTGFIGVTAGWQRALDGEAEARHEREVADESVRQATEAIHEFYLYVSQEKLRHRPGFAPLRKKLLASAQKYFEGLQGLRSRDPTLQFELALSKHYLACITEEIGSKEEAVEKYQQALMAFRELAERDPQSPWTREKLGTVYNCLGLAQHRLGRHEEALANLGKGRDVLTRLARESAIPEFARALAACCIDTGMVYSASGKHNREAEAAFAEGRAILEVLVHGQPDEPRYQHLLVDAYLSPAFLAMQSGRNEAALDLCSKAIDLATPLLSRDPENAGLQCTFAKAYSLRGSVETLLGRPVEALQSMGQSISKIEELCNADPSQNDWQFVLASTLVNRGMLHFEAQRDAEAQADLDHAWKHLNLLLKTNPSDIAFQDTLAKYWFTLALLQQATGDLAKARSSFRQTCQTNEKVLELHGGPDITLTAGVRKLELLAQSYNELGALERLMNDCNAALICHQRGRELLEKVLTVEPENARARRTLGAHWHNEGDTLRLLGRREEAIAFYQHAIVEQRRAFQQIPDNVYCRQFLANHYVMLGRVQRELGRPADACAALVEASRLWPNDPKRLHDFAAELTQTAALIDHDSLEHSNYLDQAFTLLRQAVARGFNNVKQLQENPAFAELRKRTDFQDFLKGLHRENP